MDALLGPACGVQLTRHGWIAFCAGRLRHFSPVKPISFVVVRCDRCASLWHACSEIPEVLVHSSNTAVPDQGAHCAVGVRLDGERADVLVA